jgi:hypothetical protein
MSHADSDHGNTPPVEEPSQLEAQSTFVQARQRRKIADLEGKLEILESGRAVKERYYDHHCHASSQIYLPDIRQTNYHLAQGRGIRRIVALFDTVEDLVAENDRRYDDEDSTVK